MRDGDYIKVEIIDGKKYGYVVTNWDEYKNASKVVENKGTYLCTDNNNQKYFDEIRKIFKKKYRLEEISQ
jgi:hypothetical protein